MLDSSQSMDYFLDSVERRAFRMARIAANSDDDALDIVQDAMYALVKYYAGKPRAEWRDKNRRMSNEQRGSFRNK